jgi:hypothetical protein
VSARSRSAGIIRIDMNTISNSDSQLQFETLIDMNSLEDLSEEVRYILGDEHMRVGARRSVRLQPNP